jgi:hypothetical protein
MIDRRLANRPRTASHGEALPASELMPRRLLLRVPLLADGRIESYRLALAGKARHTDCCRPAVMGK